MAETAWRTGYGHGSDTVRRLLARPIRLQATQAARQAVIQPTVSEPEAIDGPNEGQAEPILDPERLRTEMLLIKAVLQAERRENAQLRACVGLDETDETLGEEARAVRERWAALVDRLLHATA